MPDAAKIRKCCALFQGLPSGRIDTLLSCGSLRPLLPEGFPQSKWINL